MYLTRTLINKKKMFRNTAINLIVCDNLVKNESSKFDKNIRFEPDVDTISVSNISLKYINVYVQNLYKF